MYGGRDIIPLILNHGIRRRWVVNITSQSLYTWQTSPVPSGWGWVGHITVVTFRRREESLATARNRKLDRQLCCLAATSTMLILILRLETSFLEWYFLVRTHCTVQVTSFFRCFGGGGGANLRCKIAKHCDVSDIDTRASWLRSNTFSSKMDSQYVTSELTMYRTE